MDKIKNLIDNFKGEIYDLCFEILNNTSDQCAAFEYTCKNLLQKPEKGTIDIQKNFSKEEIDSYESLYGATINSLIKTSIKKCNLGIISEEFIYIDLWESFCKIFTTNKERAFAFFYTVIDKTIPYQYLGKTISMSNERFRQLSEENQSFIEKIKYIKRNFLTERTEDASLVLNCLDEIEDREAKVVVLAHAFSIFGQDPFSIFSDKKDIGTLIEQIDKKIAQLEVEKTSQED